MWVRTQSFYSPPPSWLCQSSLCTENSCFRRRFLCFDQIMLQDAYRDCLFGFATRPWRSIVWDTHCHVVGSVAIIISRLCTGGACTASCLAQICCTLIHHGISVPF